MRDNNRMWRIPLDADMVSVPHGRVVIIPDRCKGCGFCIEFCPRKVLDFSEEFNSKGYHLPVVVHPELCISCGLCELLCPDFAIFAVKDREVTASEEIQRQNGEGVEAKVEE